MSRLASSASGQGSGERPQALVGVTWGGSCWRCCSCGPVCLGRELAWGTKQGPGPKTRAENVYQAGEYDKYLFTHLENRIRKEKQSLSNVLGLSYFHSSCLRSGLPLKEGQLSGGGWGDVFQLLSLHPSGEEGISTLGL